MQISLVFIRCFLCFSVTTDHNLYTPMHKCSINWTSLSSIEAATPTAHCPLCSQSRNQCQLCIYCIFTSIIWHKSVKLAEGLIPPLSLPLARVWCNWDESVKCIPKKMNEVREKRNRITIVTITITIIMTATMMMISSNYPFIRTRFWVL